MPMMMFRVAELSTHVTERVARQVADSLLTMMNLKQYFADKDALYFYADWLAVSSSSDGSANANLQRDRCDIVIDHALNPSEVHWPEAVTFRHIPAYGLSKRDKNDDIPLFSDPVADVQLVETYEPFSLSLKFTMKFKEREMAELAFTAIKGMTHATGIHHTHDVAYSYPLSLDVCTALYLIYMQRSDYYDYDKRGLLAPDGSDLAVKLPWLRYLYQHAGQDVGFEILKADVAVSQPQRQLQVNRRTLGALGYLDFAQTKPQAVEEDEITDRWEIEFDYHLQFGRPSNLKLYYPIIVENRLLPAPLVQEQEPTNMFDVEGVFQSKGFNSFLRQTRERFPRFTVKLPFYDDFCLPYGLAIVRWRFHPLLISAFTLDDGPATMLDLVTGFGDVKLHPIVIELMKLHGRDLFGDTGLFAVAVLANDKLLDPDLLTISPDLQLSCAVTNKKWRYHLAISEATDLSHVDPKWWPYIGKYPWFFPLIITNSFNQLVQAGVIQVSTDPGLLLLIARCIASGELDIHIAKLIAAGHCSNEIYQATTGAGQFVAYLRAHISPVSKRSLYAEMIDIALAAGCLTNIPDDSYTGFLPGRGGSDAFGFPFRVLGGIITVAR